MRDILPNLPKTCHYLYLSIHTISCFKKPLRYLVHVKSPAMLARRTAAVQTMTDLCSRVQPRRASPDFYKEHSQDLVADLPQPKHTRRGRRPKGHALG